MKPLLKLNNYWGQFLNFSDNSLHIQCNIPLLEAQENGHNKEKNENRKDYILKENKLTIFRKENYK